MPIPLPGTVWDWRLDNHFLHQYYAKKIYEPSFWDGIVSIEGIGEYSVPELRNITREKPCSPVLHPIVVGPSMGGPGPIANNDNTHIVYLGYPTFAIS